MLKRQTKAGNILEFQFDKFLNYLKMGKIFTLKTPNNFESLSLGFRDIDFLDSTMLLFLYFERLLHKIFRHSKLYGERVKILLIFSASYLVKKN